MKIYCMCFWMVLLLLHAEARENMLFLPRQESSDLSENSRELSLHMRELSPK